jgi:hypothetical protein
MASQTFAEKVLNKKIAQLEREKQTLEGMLALQVKLVTALELEISKLKPQAELAEKTQEHSRFLEAQNEDLRSMVFVLTKNKFPCNPDHNGECLVCDCWVTDCPLKPIPKTSTLIE